MDESVETAPAVRSVQARAFFLAAAVALCAALGMAAYQRSVRITPAPVISSAINPNTACAENLALLPGIGPARGRAIVEYRKEQEAAGRSPVFASPEDLQQVRGIGPVTAERIAELLNFETD